MFFWTCRLGYAVANWRARSGVTHRLSLILVARDGVEPPAQLFQGWIHPAYLPYWSIT